MGQLVLSRSRLGAGDGMLCRRAQRGGEAVEIPNAVRRARHGTKADSPRLVTLRASSCSPRPVARCENEAIASALSPSLS